MDGVYDKLWDVTVLEYAVSMHTRRGDQSRKKLALEKVSEIHVRLATSFGSTALKASFSTSRWVRWRSIPTTTRRFRLKIRQARGPSSSG